MYKKLNCLQLKRKYMKIGITLTTSSIGWRLDKDERCRMRGATTTTIVDAIADP